MRRTRFIPQVERLEGKLMLAGDGPALPPGGLTPEPPAMETGSSSVSVSFRSEHIGYSNYLIVKVGGDQQRDIEIVGGAKGSTDDNGEVQLWFPHGILSMDVAMRGASGDFEPLATLKLDYSARITAVIGAVSTALSATPSTTSPILLSVDPSTILHDASHFMPNPLPAMSAAEGADAMDSMALDMAMDAGINSNVDHTTMPGMQMTMAMSMEGDMSAHGATATHAGNDQLTESDDLDGEHDEAVAAAPATLPQAEAVWDEDYYPEETVGVSEETDDAPAIQLAAAELPATDIPLAVPVADLIHKAMLPVESSLSVVDEVPRSEPAPPSYLARAGYAAVAVAATAGAIACDRLASRTPPRPPRRRPAWLGGFLASQPEA